MCNKFPRVGFGGVCFQHTNPSLSKAVVVSKSLTYWGREKMAAILQTTFSNSLLYLNAIVTDDSQLIQINNNPTLTSKVHGVNMGPTWVMSVPDGPHEGPMNLAIRVVRPRWRLGSEQVTIHYLNQWLPSLLPQICSTQFWWDKRRNSRISSFCERFSILFLETISVFCQGNGITRYV